MFRFRPLPWEYAVRNLLRRPARTLLTMAGLTTVVVLVFVVVGFIRGLEKSLSNSGSADVVLVYSLGMGENLEYSSIPMRSSDLLAASLNGIRGSAQRRHVSPELYLGTQIQFDANQEPGLGLVRGLTPSALLVRDKVEIEEGDWPSPDEVMVGRLVATKLGAPPESLAVGQSIALEGRDWRISGIFSAGESVFESEVWCRLDDLQQAMKRQDLSLVAMTLAPGADYADVDIFLKDRKDLELQSMPEMSYYASLQKDYRPVRMLAWFVVLLVSGAGMFAGLNTMYGAVLGRISEIATLQTIGFARRAVLASLIQEGVLLAATACLAAGAVAIVFINGTAVRFTMGAFELKIDNIAMLIGCAAGLLLGFLGAVPAAARALRMEIVEGLRTV